MLHQDRVKLLFGPYRMPKCKIGGWLRCVMRGKKRVAGLSDAPIQWPYVPRCGGNGYRSLILCGDLVRAIRRESEVAVAYHWGVTAQTVWKWRQALGVTHQTKGTTELYRRLTPETVGSPTAVRNLMKSLRSPERGAKISAAKLGKPRPASVIEALRRANLGKKASDEARRNMSAAQKRIGKRPPAAGVPWTADEEALLGTMKDREVAKRTGRTESAVSCRRYVLNVAAFTKRKPRGMPVKWTPAKDRLLGTMPDTLLARRLRCSPISVFNRRKRLKIAAFRG